MVKAQNWDDITKQWENDCSKIRRNLWFRKRRLKKFNIKKSDSILDLGCGDGLNIKILFSQGFKNIVGVDISRLLLKKAKQNNPGIKFFLSSVENLPFQNNSFNIVLVDATFEHIILLKNYFAEIKRVLVPNGLLCFVEPADSLARRFYDFVTVSPFGLLVPFLRVRKEAHLADRKVTKNWLKIEKKFPKILEKNGFKKVFLTYDILSVIGEYKKT